MIIALLILLLTSFLPPLLARERGPNYRCIYDRLSLVRECPQSEQLGVLGLRCVMGFQGPFDRAMTAQAFMVPAGLVAVASTCEGVN